MAEDLRVMSAIGSLKGCYEHFALSKSAVNHDGVGTLR